VALINPAIRADAQAFSTQAMGVLGNKKEDYQRLCTVGAVNPLASFDTGRAKVTFQGLHTPLTLSNGNRLRPPPIGGINSYPTK
jgi:hypothetical protein